MSSSKTTAYLYLFIAVLIWGMTVPIMKFALDYLPVFVLAFLRFALAALILLPIVLPKIKIKREHIPLFILSGISGVTIHIALFFMGLKLTSALNAGVLIATGPLFTLLLSSIFLKEKITKRVLIGCIVGFVGITVITMSHLSGNPQLSPVGDLMIIGSILALVIYEIFSKKLFETYTPLVVTFYSFLIGAITFGPASVPFFINNPMILTQIPHTALFALVFGILFSSLTAYLCWQKGLSKIHASKAGFFLYLDPVFATMASVIILHEVITPQFVIGSIIIFIGMLIAQLRHTHPGHEYMKSRTKNL